MDEVNKTRKVKKSGGIKKKCARRGKHVRKAKADVRVGVKEGIGITGKGKGLQSGATTFGLKDEDLKKDLPLGMKLSAPPVKIEKLTRALKLISNPIDTNFTISKEQILQLGMEFLEHVASEPTCVSVNKFFVERGFPRCEVHVWGQKYPEFAKIKSLAKEFIEDRLISLGVFENVNGRMVEMILKMHYGWKKKELLIEKEVSESSASYVNNTFMDFIVKVKENYDKEKFGTPTSDAERELSIVRDEIEKIEMT